MATGTLIYGLFADRAGTEAAIEALQMQGFDKAQLTLLEARPQRVIDGEEGGGRVEHAALDSEDHGNLMPLMAGIPGFLAAALAAGVTIVSGGTLAGVAVAALAAGTGGAALGAGASRLLTENISDMYEEQLQRGGMILVTRSLRPEQDAQARRILDEAGASRVDEYTGTSDP